ncbi:MAG: nitroreductase family protein [Promethearchaeia archaeon]
MDVIKTDFEQVIYSRRSIRRYKQEPVSEDTLKKLIDYARLAPAGMNFQAIEYILVLDPDKREKLFPLLSYAAALPKEKRTPEEGRRPTAYIIVLQNTDIKDAKSAAFDVGAAVENILLGAVNHRLAACWVGSIKRRKIRDLFDIPKNYDIKHVISLGVPDEESSTEEYDDLFKYWKDEEGNMHVPKRELDDVIKEII